MTRNTAKWRLIILVAILAIFTTSCANLRQGVSWPALELVTIDGQERVLVTFDGQVEVIDPYQGAQIHIVRDENDEIVRNANGDVQEWVIRGNELDNAQFFATPYEEDGVFLFPTYNNRILEVDVNSGNVIDPIGIPLTNGVIAEMVVTNELIYVPYRQQDVVALDRETYAEVWKVDTLEGVWATPLLHEGVLYFGSIDHKLYAVDAQNGTAIWSEPVDLDGAIASTPLIHDGFLYVGGYSHKMYQISLDGEIVSEYEGANWIWGTPVVVDDVLYYTDLSGYVYALNPDGLTEIWAERPASRGIRPAPLVTERYVIVSSRDGSVYWLDRQTGSTIQQAEVDGTPELLSDILYLPAEEEQGRPGLVLVASADTGRMVTAFNMETFSPQWVYGR